VRATVVYSGLLLAPSHSPAVPKHFNSKKLSHKMSKTLISRGYKSGRYEVLYLIRLPLRQRRVTASLSAWESWDRSRVLGAKTVAILQRKPSNQNPALHGCRGCRVWVQHGCKTFARCIPKQSTFATWLANASEISLANTLN
jgi:hypothetical protein